MFTEQMFTGCGTAMVTPFRRDGAVDEATLIRLIHRQIEAGIDFLVPCGTTGESPTLTREEHLHVVEIAVEEARKAGRKVPVLAGCGGRDIGTRAGIAACWFLRDRGDHRDCPEAVRKPSKRARVRDGTVVGATCGNEA